MIAGLLIYTQSHGRQNAQIIWSDDGKRPPIDDHTKRLMVAQHDLRVDLGELTLAEAVARFPAPPLREEA